MIFLQRSTNDSLSVHSQTWCTERNLPSLSVIDELLEVLWRQTKHSRYTVKVYRNAEKKIIMRKGERVWLCVVYVHMIFPSCPDTAKFVTTYHQHRILYETYTKFHCICPRSIVVWSGFFLFDGHPLLWSERKNLLGRLAQSTAISSAPIYSEGPEIGG